MTNGMLTIEEVKQYLEIDEEYIERLIYEERLNAYKIGGEYLRFEKEQVIALKENIHKESVFDRGFLKALISFWSANNFYIITTVALVLIVYFIFN